MSDSTFYKDLFGAQVRPMASWVAVLALVCEAGLMFRMTSITKEVCPWIGLVGHSQVLPRSAQVGG